MYYNPEIWNRSRIQKFARTKEAAYVAEVHDLKHKIEDAKPHIQKALWHIRQKGFLSNVVASHGLEPWYWDPESHVLPLDDKAIYFLLKRFFKPTDRPVFT